MVSFSLGFVVCLCFVTLTGSFGVCFSPQPLEFLLKGCSLQGVHRHPEMTVVLAGLSSVAGLPPNFFLNLLASSNCWTPLLPDDYSIIFVKALGVIFLYSLIQLNLAPPLQNYFRCQFLAKMALLSSFSDELSDLQYILLLLAFYTCLHIH